MVAPHGAAAGNGPGPGSRYGLIEAGRGAASLGVMLFHSINTYPVGALPRSLSSLRALTRWGWLGVYVFFAISGWCIADRISKGNSRGESAGHFAAERLLRIYPTYWAALFGAILLRLAPVPFNTAHLAGSLPGGWADWLGSVFLVSPYIGRSPYVLVSWSLVYELGFYLCAAIALFSARRRIARGNTLFVLGCLLCLPPWTAHGASPPWRVLDLWPDFFAGVAAWWAVCGGRARAGGYAALTLLLAVTIAWPAYGGSGRLVAVITAWVLALAWRQDRRIAGSPLVRPLIWAGAISYSLYLVHIPVISPIENLLGRWIPSNSPWFVAVWAFSLGMALLAAKCLNYLVEAPVNRWRKRAI
jgi:peptidoglycan/LPS O-acetylase OafA/YrhL